MFEYLRGQLVSKDPAHCVVEVAGVAYRVLIPLSTYRNLPERGPVQIWIYSRITEVQMCLFGFISQQERDLFSTMVDTVPALGPRRALQILSGMTAQELLQCVRSGEIGRLTRTKGIGEKLAGRLILELRGKLPARAEESSGQSTSVFNEAVLALVSLGFNRKEAEVAVERAEKGAGPKVRLEELIKRSLEHV
jgi:Holliday junction DNA helicase RuvA